MKKILVFVFSLLLSLVLVGCTNSSTLYVEELNENSNVEFLSSYKDSNQQFLQRTTLFFDYYYLLMKKTIVLDEYSYYCNDNNTLVKYNYHFENDEDVYLGYVKTVDPSVSILGITIDSSKEEVIEIFNVYGYIVTEEKTSFREKVIGYKDNITIIYSINYRGDIELSCEISDYLDNEIFYTEPVQKVLFYDVFLVLLSRLYTLIVGLIIMYLGKRSRSNVQFFNFRFK